MWPHSGSIGKIPKCKRGIWVCSNEKVDLIRNLNICEDVLAYDAIDFQNALDSALLTENGDPKLDLILDTVSSPESGDVGK